MSKNVVLEVKNNEFNQTIATFLNSLLEQNLVFALLVPREVPSKVNVVQSLITRPITDGINPLAPVMPVNSAKIISDITNITPSTRRTGVLLRSCEIRALIELVKLKQASLDNFVIFGIDCLGTYSISYYKEMVSQGKSPTLEFLKCFKEGKDDSNLRQSCKVCEYFVPQNTDITIGLLGIDFDKELLIQSNTETGEEILDKLGLKEFGDTGDRDKVISKIIADKVKRKEELFSMTQQEVSGLDNLVSFFAPCIGCHNCMGVCPICYCKQCLFESPTFEFESEQYFRWADKKKSIRMPTDTVLFHLARMNHMLTSCVGCGMCEQACPNNIELLKIFKMVGENVQKVFDYVPGRSIEEELPISTFKEEELGPR